MGKHVLNILFYIGLCVFTMGTLSRIQHWPFGSIIQFAGSFLEVLFFLFVSIEIFTSKKASTSAKGIYGSCYVILPALGFLYVPAVVLIFGIFIGGTIYLNSLRQKFLFTINRRNSPNPVDM